MPVDLVFWVDDDTLRIWDEEIEAVEVGEKAYEYEVTYEGKVFKADDMDHYAARQKMVDALLAYLKPVIDAEQAKLKAWNEGKPIIGVPRRS